MATPNDFASIVSGIYQNMVDNGYTGTEADLAVALSALSDDNGATTKWIDLGASSAYAIAVEHGYTGTEEEWIALLMNITQNAQIAKDSADSAEESAASARQSEEAIPAKKDEALQAIASAESGALQSVNTAGTTQTGNVNTAGQTQVQAVNTAGTTQVGLVQDEGSDQRDVIIAEGERQTQRVSNQGILEVQAVSGEGTKQKNEIDAVGQGWVDELEGSGDDLIAEHVADLVLSQDTQPDNRFNKLWLKTSDEDVVLAEMSDVQPITDDVANLKSALPINKAEVFGGSIAPIFELGIVYFDNNWQYVNSNKRIRFPQGMTIHLEKGSTIALSSYENAKFNVGWKINGVIAGYSGWITTTYTTQVEAEYAISVMSNPETAQSSPDALASLVLVNGVSPFAIAENKRLYDSGNVVSKENILPGYVNIAGWFANTPTAAQERTTGFIPVTPGDKWTAYLRSSSNFKISFACYSEAKDGNTKFLTPRHDYETYETDGAYKYNFATFTIPEGCYFIRVCFATDGLENYYLYNTTAKDPNGLLALKGYYQIDGIRADISDAEKNIFNTDKEINIQGYTSTAYNLESGKWASSAVYRCILVPVSDLAFSIRFVADTYKCSYAFLRSNTITVGEVPDLCGGEKITTLTTGNEKIVKVPDDCEYLYVYITDGSQFGKYHVINRALRKDFNPVRNNAKGVAYISDVDQILRTIKHRHDGNANTFSGTNWSDNLLVLAQITDVHSDPTSYARFISFLNENTDTINAGIVSGDLVDHGADNQFALMIGCESELSENATLIKCLGNHEMQSTKTQAETYTAYGLDTNTGKSYYYVDYATQKIRIICLDQYDTDSTDTNIKTRTAHYSQAQIDWLINTLKDATTNGYAVIVVYHSCNEVGFPTYNDSGFCQDREYAMFPSPTSGTIISDIIDAFQNATALDETYTASDISVTLTVDTSFTAKGIFICYICGHEHIDYVGYSSKYPRQLICIAQGGVVVSQSRTESEAHWQSMYDTPRVANTSTHDSFNVYGFDTVNRLVKIAKIGSTITDKFVPRSFATFRY